MRAQALTRRDLTRRCEAPLAGRARGDAHARLLRRNVRRNALLLPVLLVLQLVLQSVLAVSVLAPLVAVSLPAAVASAGVTYHFIDSVGGSVTNVYTEVYTCANYDCSQVTATFRRSLFSGSQSTQTVAFPTVLQSQYGYGVYQMAQCFIPKAGVATWAGDGSQDWQYQFEKVPGCKSDIIQASVSPQTGQVGQRIDLAMQYRSAFRQTLPRPRYIPTGYDAYFSSDLTASVTVTRSGQAASVFQQSKPESLLMDSEGSASWSWTPTEAGTYTITFTTDVSDCQCLSDQPQQREFTMTITGSQPQNQPPIAVASAVPQTTTVGQQVAFSSEGSYDPDGTIASYAWTFGDTVSSTSANPSHSFATPGTYTATLRVTDNLGLQSQPASVTVTVQQQTNPPTATLTVNPSSGTRPLSSSVSCTGSGGTAPLSYTVDFGDGTPSAGPQSTSINVQHTFQQSATVTCTVTDSQGRVGTAQRAVTVSAPPPQNQPPTVQAFANPDTGAAPLSTTLSAQASDPDGYIVSYAWNFGDGSQPASGQSVPHTYQYPTTYAATVTVTDDDGLTATDNVQVTVTQAQVQNQPPVAVASASPQSTTVGQQVSFSSAGSYDPDGSIASYAWQFTDGTSSTIANPTKSFAYPGTYTGTLVVTDNQGASSQPASASVIVQQPTNPPTASLTVNPMSGTRPLSSSVSCTGSGGTAPLSYTVDFGDGTAQAGPQSTSISVQHTFQQSATVTCTVTDSQGRMASAQRYVTVSAPQNQPPIVDALANPASGTAPLSTILSAQASDPDGYIVSYAWTFGDGQTGSGQSALHVYQNPGTYTARVTVTDNQGLSASDIVSVSATQTQVPTASVSAQPNSGQSPLQSLISCTGTGSGQLYYRVDFGDGTSYGPLPFSIAVQHAFQQSTTVSCTVTDSQGRSASATAPVTVTVNQQPTALLTASPQSGNAPLAVSLYCTGSGGNAPLHYQIMYGDGGQSIDSLSPISITHSYSQSTTATCRVRDLDGDVAIDTKQITINQNTRPTITCAASATSGRVPLQVSFTSQAQGDSPLTYAWAFGDGATSPGQDVQHTYGIAGTYTARVTVTDRDGETATCTAGFIAVTQNQGPVVDAQANPSSGHAPLATTLSAQASDPDGYIVSYAWTFGDGSASASGQSVPHTYQAPGSYIATVVVTDNDGLTAQDSVVITVSQDAQPTAVITATPRQGTAPLQVALGCTGSGGNAPLRYQLLFGDGSGIGPVSQPISTTHLYTRSATATCIVTDADGDVAQDTATLSIDADIDVQAICSATPTSGVAPLAVTLSATAVGGNGPLTYTWQFGDGTTGSGALVQHTFPVGTYAPRVTIVDADGDSADCTVHVIQSNSDVPPEVVLTVDPKLGRAPLNSVVTCLGLNGNGPLSYRVDFGDGSPVFIASGAVSVQHTFTRSSVVTCTVTDSDGDVGIGRANATIVAIVPPVVNISAVPSVGNAPLHVQFSSTASDPDGFIVAYHWTFGDGSASSSLVNPNHIYTQPGNYVATLTVTDNDGLQASDSVAIQVTSLPGLEITGLECFPRIVLGEQQAFSVRVRGDGQPRQGAAVTLFANNMQVGTCTTAAQSGACSVSITPAAIGNYTAYATASLAGFAPDNDHAPICTYEVVKRELMITGLATYNDSFFANPDDVFYRNETVYVRFTVHDLSTGYLVPDAITSVTIVSPPGGRLQLTKLQENAGNYYYMGRIPPNHDFLGTSQVFSFAFKDGKTGEATVQLDILNNPPEIRPLGSFVLDHDQMLDIPLSPYEFDVEDHGINLTWSVLSADPFLFTASMVTAGSPYGQGAKTLRLQAQPGQSGDSTVQLTLRDLNDAQAVRIVPVSIRAPLPVISLTVAIEPKPATTADALFCRAVSNATQLSYRWYRNGASTAFTAPDVASSNTARGDAWNCTVTATTQAVSITRSDEVTIGNSAPQAQVALSPRAPDSATDLSCAMTSSDIDGDMVTLAYTITGLTQPVSGSCTSSCTIPVSHTLTTKGHAVTCRAVPTDSQGMTGPAASDTVGIGGQSPFIVSVSITPSSPHSSDDLTCVAIAQDPDNDPITITYRWEHGASVIAGQMLSHTYTARGDVWTCIATATAGGESVSGQASVTVGNAGPTIVSTPETHITLDDVTDPSIEYVYQARAVDPDSDVLYWSLDFGPSGMRIDANGKITWEPGRNDVGTHPVQVRVSDGQYDDVQYYQIIVDEPDEVNTARERIYWQHLLIQTLCVEPGDQAFVQVAFENTGFFTLEDAKITVYMPDLNLMTSTGMEDVDAGDTMSKTLYLDIPYDAPNGWYDLRVAAGNGDYRRIRHRELLVADQCCADSYCPYGSVAPSPRACASNTGRPASQDTTVKLVYCS